MSFKARHAGLCRAYRVNQDCWRKSYNVCCYYNVFGSAAEDSMSDQSDIDLLIILTSLLELTDFAAIRRYEEGTFIVSQEETIAALTTVEQTLAFCQQQLLMLGL
jgi:predicted nucleotidyltransferase